MFSSGNLCPIRQSEPAGRTQKERRGAREGSPEFQFFRSNHRGAFIDPVLDVPELP